MRSIRNPATGLTGREESFSVQLAMGGSQAAAYRRAFPATVHWQKNTVWSASGVMARNPLVKQRVQQLLRAAADANEMTIVEVVALLKQRK